MLPNVLHGRRVSDAFPRQAHIRGVTSATGPTRHRPARPLGASPPAGPSRRRRPLTRIGPARPHPVTQGDSRTRSLRPGTPLVPPAGRHTRQWPEKCAPDGVLSWVFAATDHPAGAHFSGCQGVPALSRGDPGPWPRRARGGSGAGAGSAACDCEAYWGAFPHNILSAKTSSETPGMVASWPPSQA